MQGPTASANSEDKSLKIAPDGVGGCNSLVFWDPYQGTTMAPVCFGECDVTCDAGLDADGTVIVSDILTLLTIFEEDCP